MIKTKKGFTLIELLVVIAIIGILSAIGLVSLNGAREKARDSKAKSDLSTFRTGLTLYYDDYSNTYPGNVVAGTADVSSNTSAAAATGVFASGGRVVTEYVAAITSPSANKYQYLGNNGVTAHTIGSTTAGVASQFALFYKLESSGSNNYYFIDYFDGSSDTFKDIKDQDSSVPVCASAADNCTINP